MTDTTNDFLVASDGDLIVTLLPVRARTRQQAYRLAAWIKLCANTLDNDSTEATYEEIEEAIAGT